MRELQDYFTVSVDRVYEHAGQKSKSGIIKLNENWIDPEEETRFVYKRLCGTIVSGPIQYSNAPSGDYIHVGVPEPKSNIGHDQIADFIKRGYKNWSRADYNPSTFDGYKMIPLSEYAKRISVRQGDKIYFTEVVTERENFLGPWGDGSMLFRCRVDNIICVVRDEQIIMQGTWVLVDPVMETWEDITTPAGVIAKVAPEGRPLQGIIKHIQTDDHYEVDDKIIYLPDSNWGLTVEERDCFAIREKEIICRVKKQRLDISTEA